MVGGPTISVLQPYPQMVTIYDDTGAQVPFRYDGVITTSGPNFIVVIPSSGITPATVFFDANSRVVAQLRPGQRYGNLMKFTTVGQSPESTVTVRVDLILPKAPPPQIRGVVNGASGQPVVAPGALVSIIGSNLTGPTLATEYDDIGQFPTETAGTSVTFNGMPAALRYLSPGQIEAVVPYAIAGQRSLSVVVQRFGQESAAFTVPAQDTAPGIFVGQYKGPWPDSIRQRNPDGDNSEDHPAPRGAALEIYATGAGVWTPAPQADTHLFGASFRTLPVSVTIGGVAARVLYAGTGSSDRNWSTLQVNVLVPEGVGSGAQPVVLKIGDADSLAQKAVVWVQ